ncbi:MAG: hypothetical protein KC713_08905 [Candidatus Omnitrophica bacterium]|nr:hypothetical protein [Candidatus Omnitrophota bacterium]
MANTLPETELQSQQAKKTHLLIASQNLKYYDMNFPEGTIFRVNLAWLNSLQDLENIIKDVPNDIYLDMPIGRTKPPSNSYTLDELIPFIENHQTIKYLAISNIESKAHIAPFLHLTDSVIIVPKIETKKGIENIDEIVKALDDNSLKIIMLDHDDLFSDLIKHGIHANEFPKYITSLVEYCDRNDVNLLRTRGVIFSS